MTRVATPLLLALAGCSSADNAGDPTNDDVRGPEDAGNDGAVALRIDVVPGTIREEGDESAFRALPQTFRPLGLAANDLSAGTLELYTPQPQTGSVVGYRTNPQIALIPGTVEAVDATVWMRAPGTVQSVFTRTGTAGAFELWVVPRSEYRLEIVPDDPLFPVWAADLTVGPVPVDQPIDLGTGVPVYGVVTSEEGPVAGALVRAVDDLGLSSQAALTDEFGIYQVRVTPGTWTIVCDGRDLGRDPTITVPAVAVGDVGANVDVTYPATLDTVLVEGVLVANNGVNVQGTTVRFTAESLIGYESIGAVNGNPAATATWGTETSVSTNGTILTRIVEGTYTVEVLPPTVDSGPDFSPERLTGVPLDASVTQLGTLTVTPLVAVTGEVRTESFVAIPDAVVTCVEAEFDQRFWTTTADANGAYATQLPEVLVHCDVAPPADRGDLAPTRVSFDPGAGVTLMDFTVPVGVDVTGSVTIDGAPEPFAIVNVYDESDRLLGFGVTGEDGTFEIPVDLE